MEESNSITRKSASNLALAFILLPRSKRDGMTALYAFCREVDDVADDESVPVAERRVKLAAWRADIRRACEGGTPEFAVNREFQPVIQAYKLPFALFDELILGVEMYLDIKRYETIAQLEHYCYRVASVVGLLSIEIFGYKNPACRNYADALGKALQLTNILRDVRTDAERGRIYLPQDEMSRYGVSEQEILRFEYSDRFRKLCEHLAGRAREHYRNASRLLPAEDRRAMAAAELMGMVYWRLLRKLEARRFDVLGPKPTKLSKAVKLSLIARSWVRNFSGTLTPSYGTP